ncbi:penicillin-binding protein 2 [Oscillibacter sp. PC13]|uniref:penicillin-binding transpeptidase domain-containing protein n=1 Tax=Oscillibacter sp. PC13 TaxID=1855299 RepID=UPI0008E30D63|nr:penicillin-binding transpeptidase domain-containing protein [Oscillibacter sp. PC13]SFP78245.1 penicillin-binding protein 2 [Oscillibacter sp. PC13]
MEHREKSNLRLYVLAGFLLAVLAVYIGVLFDTQVNRHQDYLEKSIRTITQEEKVEASRGGITDRNGRALVSSRSSYNLTFDASLLGDEVDENQAILRLLELCEVQGVAWTDNLPISTTAPFFYTLDQLPTDSTQRSRFATFLQKEMKLMSTNVKAENVTAELLSNLDLDADTLLDTMRETYEIPADFSPRQARLVLGVRYELAIRNLIHTTAYVLAEDIDATMISLLNDGGYAGAKITTASVREYKTDYAAHILGPMGKISDMSEVEELPGKYSLDDWVGKGGVELAFEEYLKGTNGTRIVSANSDGKITGEYYYEVPKPGSTVELTIDLSLQAAVEDALAETVSRMNKEDGKTTRGASAVVTAVGTGEVLALASYPTFHLATYLQDYSSLSNLELNPGNPLWNRATQGTYAPGSTFKPLTAIAALQESVITPYQKLATKGHWTYPGAPSSYANCWLYNSTHGNHGKINVSQAITVSCNYFFAEMGYRLGMDTLNEYASAFGLGESTGIEIGDRAGNLVENKVGENLAPWAAFGQASYLFTPLQLSNYIATLVSGGKHCQAHLLKAVKSYDNTAVLAVGNTEPLNTLDISDANLEAVKEGMLALTTTGSLSSYFKNCVVKAGAKTGTAQINAKTKNTGVFVCFAPYEDPEIAISILIEEGGSGAALANTAVSILNAYFTADEIGTSIIGENQLLR